MMIGETPIAARQIAYEPGYMLPVPEPLNPIGMYSIGAMPVLWHRGYVPPQEPLVLPLVFPEVTGETIIYNPDAETLTLPIEIDDIPAATVIVAEQPAGAWAMPLMLQAPSKATVIIKAGDPAPWTLPLQLQNVSVTVLEGGVFFVTFTDTDTGTHYRRSTMDYEDMGGETPLCWDKGVKGVTGITIQAATDGGYIHPSIGSIGVIPGTLPKKRKYALNIQYGFVSVSAITILEGTAILESDPESLWTYTVYETEYDAELLETGVNTDGEEVDLPLVIGYLSVPSGAVHMEPQRTGEDTEMTFYLPGFDGVSIENGVLSGMTAYDDGVAVTGDPETGDVWSISGNTISRSTSFLGVPTFSGKGVMKNLKDVLAWGAGRLGLTLDMKSGGSERIDAIITQKQLLIDFLADIALYCGYVFYIRSGVMVVVDRLSGNGLQKIERADRTPVTPKRPSIKSYAASWSYRIAKTTRENGHFISEEKDDVTLPGPESRLGAEKTVNKVFNFANTHVKARVQKLLDIESRPLISFEIPMTCFPVPGEVIEFEDVRPEETISGSVFVDAVLMSSSSRVKISGRGVVTES